MNSRTLCCTRVGHVTYYIVRRSDGQRKSSHKDATIKMMNIAIFSQLVSNVQIWMCDIIMWATHIYAYIAKTAHQYRYKALKIKLNLIGYSGILSRDNRINIYSLKSYETWIYIWKIQPLLSVQSICSWFR